MFAEVQDERTKRGPVVDRNLDRRGGVVGFDHDGVGAELGEHAAVVGRVDPEAYRHRLVVTA